jgi:hypothetical protein
MICRRDGAGVLEMQIVENKLKKYAPKFLNYTNSVTFAFLKKRAARKVSGKSSLQA